MRLGMCSTSWTKICSEILYWKQGLILSLIEETKDLFQVFNFIVDNKIDKKTPLQHPTWQFVFFNAYNHVPDYNLPTFKLRKSDEPLDADECPRRYLPDLYKIESFVLLMQRTNVRRSSGRGKSSASGVWFNFTSVNPLDDFFISHFLAPTHQTVIADALFEAEFLSAFFVLLPL